MYIPSELWTEVKNFSGIYSISTDWTFPYLYAGNWIQFYLEIFQPTVEDIQEIRNSKDIRRKFFRHRFPREFWHLLHRLNRLHKNNLSILPIIKNCNVLLETNPSDVNRKNYNMFAIHIPYVRGEEGREIELIHNIHMLTVRCKLSNLFFCYEKTPHLTIILTVCF